MVTHAAQRMLVDGEWIVPPFASGLWLDKPPLVNWLTAASFLAFGGFSEFAARLPAALSTIGLCILVAALAQRFLSWRAALFAGLVQATCIYTYAHGRLGELDMPFAFLMSAAYAVLAVHWSREDFALPWRAAVVFHTLAGLAVVVLSSCARPLRACRWRKNFTWWVWGNHRPIRTSCMRTVSTSTRRRICGRHFVNAPVNRFGF